MKLKSQNEVSECLQDFALIIEKKAAGNNCEILSLQNALGRKIFVDQRQSQELLFLIQLYNIIAQHDTTNEIDLDSLFNDKLKEKGLFGINPDELDPDLLTFFSKCGQIKPRQHAATLIEKLNADVTELTNALHTMGDNHCFKDPVNNLIHHVNETGGDLFGTASNKNLANIVTDTRKLIAPKFGEKNCFSFEARKCEYKRKAVGNGLASVASGVLGAAAAILSLAVFIGTIVGIAELCSLVPPIFVMGVMLAGMLAATLPILGGLGLYMLSTHFMYKANQQRQLCGTMFSIANADRKHNDNNLSACVPDRTYTSPSFS